MKWMKAGLVVAGVLWAVGTSVGQDEEGAAGGGKESSASAGEPSTAAEVYRDARAHAGDSPYAPLLQQSVFNSALNPYVLLDTGLTPVLPRNPLFHMSLGQDVASLNPFWQSVGTSGFSAAPVCLEVQAEGKVVAAYQMGQPLPFLLTGAELIVTGLDGNVALRLAVSADGSLRFPDGCKLTVQLPQITRTPAKVGLDLAMLDLALAKHLSLDAQSAMVVATVEDGGPASLAGVEQYDIIVSIDGQSPVSTALLRTRLAEYVADMTVILEVQRGLQRLEIAVDPVADRTQVGGTIYAPWSTMDSAFCPTVIPSWSSDWATFAPWVQCHSRVFGVDARSVDEAGAEEEAGAPDLDQDAPAAELSLARRIERVEALLEKTLANQEELLKALADG